MKKINVAVGVFTLMLFGCNTQKKQTSAIASEEHTHKDYFGAYTLEDKYYGTKTIVTIEKGIRKMVSNGLPNHDVGKFPNEGNPNKISKQNVNYSFPVKPFYTGQSKWVREPGVALNGVKFEPETAERYECESGEVYKVEAIQQLINLGLDYNNAHVQPTGAYHYHAKPVSILRIFDTGKDLIHVGFAKDGFPMYYSKSGAYKSSFRLVNENREGVNCSYNRKPNDKEDLKGTEANGTFVQDWEFVEGLGDLDKCNGARINGSYAYVITDEYPYVSRCLNGKFKEEKHPGPPPGHRGRRPNGPPPPRHGRSGHERPPK